MPDPCNGHIAIQFGGVVYDCGGVCDGRAISKGITSKTMEEFLRMPCWNSTFRCSNASLSSVLDTLEDFFAYAFESLPITHKLNGRPLDD